MFAKPNWDAYSWEEGPTVDANSLGYLPRRSSKNCDLQFEISPETIKQELRPTVCEKQQRDRFNENYGIYRYRQFISLSITCWQRPTLYQITHSYYCSCDLVTANLVSLSTRNCIIISCCLLTLDAVIVQSHCLLKLGWRRNTMISWTK